MKPSEAFTIVVRTLGLLLALSSLATLFYALADLALGGLGIGLIVWMNFGIPSLAVGLWLLVGFGLWYPSFSPIGHRSPDLGETFGRRSLRRFGERRPGRVARWGDRP
jgi:hypothetical protein